MNNALAILTLVGTAVAWIAAARNRRIEIEKLKADAELGKGTAVEQMQKAYTQFVADRTSEYTEVAAKNQALENRIGELEKREINSAKERGELKGKVETLTKQRESDQKTIERLQHEIEGYKKEIQEYKTLLEQYKCELEKHKSNAVS